LSQTGIYYLLEVLLQIFQFGPWIQDFIFWVTISLLFLVKNFILGQKFLFGQKFYLLAKNFICWSKRFLLVKNLFVGQRFYLLVKKIFVGQNFFWSKII